MSEELYDICNVCGEWDYLEETRYVFEIQCQCCDSKHYEELQHCPDCKPEVPQFVSYVSRSGVEMIDIESSLLTYMHGN
jgi:hypothetical protein